MLKKLKEQYGLEYVLAINNDDTCPMYPDDSHSYIYTGVVGKLLPCFYIQGRETHVGQCFEGYDPNTVAAKLTAEINLNTAFCDAYKGEYSLPPVALKLKDLKEWYNVQTLYEAAIKVCPALKKELGIETERFLEAKEDKREIPITLIRMMLAKANIYHPVVVLYFAAPYCPHNTLQEKDGELLGKLEKIVGEIEEENGLHYEICRFFPSLSDSSYLSIDDSGESIELLKKNFPQMEQLYPLPLERKKALNIKAVNFGVYGKDGTSTLKKVLVSRPQFLKPASINEIAKIWKDTTMDVETMLREHREFVDAYHKAGVEVKFFEPD